MNLTQTIRALRALEARIDALEPRIAALENKVSDLSRPDAPKEKRPYNRKTPNAAIAPESVCPSSPMEN